MRLKLLPNILRSIAELSEPNGSTLDTITKCMIANYHLEPTDESKIHIFKTIQQAMENSIITEDMRGRYKNNIRILEKLGEKRYKTHPKTLDLWPHDRILSTERNPKLFTDFEDNCGPNTLRKYWYSITPRRRRRRRPKIQICRRRYKKRKASIKCKRSIKRKRPKQRKSFVIRKYSITPRSAVKRKRTCCKKPCCPKLRKYDLTSQRNSQINGRCRLLVPQAKHLLSSDRDVYRTISPRTHKKTAKGGRGKAVAQSKRRKRLKRRTITPRSGVNDQLDHQFWYTKMRKMKKQDNLRKEAEKEANQNKKPKTEQPEKTDN